MNGASRRTSTALVAILLLSVVAGAGVFAASASTADDGSMEQATAIEPGESSDGVIESSNDTDWYEVQVQDGHTFLFTVVKRSIDAEGDTMERDLAVGIYDADGDALSEGTLDAMDQRQHPSFAEDLEGGTYYIKVAADYGEEHEGKQGYSLNTESVESDPHEPNDSAENATALGGDAAVSANTIGNDLDYYSVDVDAGETVTVNYTENGDRDASRGHAATVITPSGDRLDQDDIGDDSRISFTASEDGNYLVFVHPDEGGRILSMMQVTQYDLTVDVTEDAGEDDSQDDTDDSTEDGDDSTEDGDDSTEDGDDSTEDGDDSTEDGDDSTEDGEETDDAGDDDSKEGDCAV